MPKNVFKKKLRGSALGAEVTALAVTVVVVLVTLIIGTYIVNQVNSTIQANIGIRPNTIYGLIGVTLIVLAAVVILYALKSLQKGAA